MTFSSLNSINLIVWKLKQTLIENDTFNTKVDN